MELPFCIKVSEWYESVTTELYIMTLDDCFVNSAANARLRIVSERVDIIDNLILSVTVFS